MIICDSCDIKNSFAWIVIRASQRISSFQERDIEDLLGSHIIWNLTATLGNKRESVKRLVRCWICVESTVRNRSRVPLCRRNHSSREKVATKNRPRRRRGRLDAAPARRPPASSRLRQSWRSRSPRRYSLPSLLLHRTAAEQERSALQPRLAILDRKGLRQTC